MTEQDILWLIVWCLVGAVVGRILAYPLFHWRMERIKRNVKKDIAHKEGVSQAFVDETIANSDRLVSGKITEKEWLQETLQIAARYPKDTDTLLSQEER